jgi:hypothetical protein
VPVPLLLQPGAALGLSPEYNCWCTAGIEVRDCENERRILTVAHGVGALARGYTANHPVVFRTQARMFHDVGVVASSSPESWPESSPCDIEIDAALIAPLPHVVLGRRISNDIKTRPTVVREGEVRYGSEVIMRGAESGFRSATVLGTDVDVYLTNPLGADHGYRGLIAVMAEDGRPFARQGDSGAAVVGSDGQLVGIVVGAEEAARGADSMAYVQPMYQIVRCLGLLSPHMDE